MSWLGELVAVAVTTGLIESCDFDCKMVSYETSVSDMIKKGEKAYRKNSSIHDLHACTGIERLVEYPSSAHSSLTAQLGLCELPFSCTCRSFYQKNKNS